MEAGGSSRKKRLTDLVLSWSLEDIQNENLYKDQVTRIPESFDSVKHYFKSFIGALLEETRAELYSQLKAISHAPFAEVLSLNKCQPHRKLLYNVKVNYWRTSSRDHDKNPYRAFPGDILIFTEAKPEIHTDLLRMGRTWTFGCIVEVSEYEGVNNGTATCFKVEASNHFDVKGAEQRFLVVVFLMNITTNKRIWKALHTWGNLDVIKSTLSSDSIVEKACDVCPHARNRIWAKESCISSELNESQCEAIVDALSRFKCDHKCFVELIWGPPGTGKTRTLSIFLCTLLGLNYRTLICSPTNVAITEVVSRVVKLIKKPFHMGSGSDISGSCLGDALLFGNKDQLNINSDIEEIYLDYRVQQLLECFEPMSGLKHCLESMRDFLESCLSCYQMYCDNELTNAKHHSRHEEIKTELDSFLVFARRRFTYAALKRRVSILCTHVPKKFILEHNFQQMVSLVDLLDSFEHLLFHDNMDSEELKRHFLNSDEVDDSSKYIEDVANAKHIRNKCLCVLRRLSNSLNEINLPCTTDRASIENFCFQRASLFFCTASSSYKLRSVKMNPLQILIIDEAAQLKECESIVPLQLPGVRHAVLIGDECQLPAMVRSNVSVDAGFGRSLFERLSLLNHHKHLLNIQYRMHPSISFFPNSRFYQGRIMDSQIVNSKGYEKHYLPGPMFGPYSFINISGGIEECDITGSWKNMVEVAVVCEILWMLKKACSASGEKLTLGVVSPYTAQVSAITQKLGQRYENHVSLTVKVKSVDGFQGGEEDIIIMSTVRSGSSGKVGFISSLRRVNVALTRARRCIWILGNESTLIQSQSVWDEIISDAKHRHSFFNADEDENIKKIILAVKRELNQLDDLLNGNSILFKEARWKVLFSDNFRKSFAKLKSSETKNLIIFRLSKLLAGERPSRKNECIISESQSGILKKFKVRDFYIICSIDIIKKDSKYTQAFKVWDVLPLHDILRLVRRMDGIFEMYTIDYLNRCKAKCIEGDLEVPMTWDLTAEIVQYKSLNGPEVDAADASSLDERTYVEDSKVSDSLLLMKFYSMSSGAVKHLLSGCDGEELGLPFELTDQEKEIIGFNKSTFILGRSGTGKTTVLTTKLYQNEQLCCIASEGFHDVKHNKSVDMCSEDDGSESGRMTSLRLHQLFVTVSPKLCFAVKQHVSYLKSYVCGGSNTTQKGLMQMDDFDGLEQFAEIPDSFIDLPPNSYPLVITFHKFLTMLDRTIGASYFLRFPDVQQLCHGKTDNPRSMAMETFIRTREVSYDRFSSCYWHHFNNKLTKEIDSSIVFTEIMSVIKGGLRAGESPTGTLSRVDYVLLSDCRVSTLRRQKREIVYDIYLEYEKKKVSNGDFDLADLVIDLHRRLQHERYLGDQMDFVFIDEVQDLSMRQIALFKYICRNIEEGFIFSGDTAQTITRGIDFRFEDIRCLFHKEFVLGSRRDVFDERKEKGQISKIFQLSQNFRTHAGVLRLAQTVIDLLCHFFPQSIDVLSPETSPVNGEAPIWLHSNNNDCDILSIFSDSKNAGGNVVGFGAEQVILVPDGLRKKISDEVGKNALLLTIVECKGLEFQDVLLYNFFSSSPFKNHWRVIYEYMKENDLVDSSVSSFTRFDEEEHNILCSELKQLYVAVTRTKQRLWIYENDEEISKPMFYYWRKLSLVQERQLDDAFVNEMLVASSPEQWRSRGIKLFHQKKYDKAMMCFEKAEDRYWQKLTEASALHADAEDIYVSNPKKSHSNLRKAAKIFDSVGKFELAAQCYFELKEYEIAGKIYLECFGESKLEKAGECFYLSGNLRVAAEVYAKARSYSRTLSACMEGRLFDEGLLYIEDWRQHAVIPDDKMKEMERIEQDFLQRVALHYFELEDTTAMMKFVKCFRSMELVRPFLRNLNCVNELLTLEIEKGNLLEAADIAKLKQDLLLEIDLVEKAGYFREAAMLILWFVYRKCENLNQFMQRDELLARAKLIANNHSNEFYEFVCTEADILYRGWSKEEVLMMGLEFTLYWASNAPTGVDRVKTRSEAGKEYRDLLKICAGHYYDLKDFQAMMKYVNKFDSVDSIRKFLKEFNCFDELLLLEENLGNFLEAANVAGQKGDILCKADLLEMAGHFEEASRLMLWCVFAGSLWVSGSKGWPLKNFGLKEVLLGRAKLCAMKCSRSFCEFVCLEVNMLSNRSIHLCEIKEYLSASKQHGSLKGEIISAWMILDAHLHSNASVYEWNEVQVDDLTRHSEEMVSNNKVSVYTLVYFWNYWKKKIVNLIDYLSGIGRQEVSDYTNYEDFCLNYMFLSKQSHGQKVVYRMHNSGGNWEREIDCWSLMRNEHPSPLEASQFVCAAQSYWSTQLLAVGEKVLETLNSLHDYTVRNLSTLSPVTSYIARAYKIAKFHCKYRFLDESQGSIIVSKYLELSADYYNKMYPLDWQVSLAETMEFLGRSEISMNLVKENVFESIRINNRLTYGQMGRVVMMILDTAKPTTRSCEDMVRKFDCKQWREFVEELFMYKESHLFPNFSESLVFKFLEALKNAYHARWRNERDYISPACFLHLAERLLILLSCFQGYFFMTRSSVVGWLIFEKWNVRPKANFSSDSLPRALEDIYSSMAYIVQEILLNLNEAWEWIKSTTLRTREWIKSTTKSSENYLSQLISRLVILLCLICANSGKHFDKLLSLLDRRDIRSQLPQELRNALRRGRKCYFIDALADALERMGNPLVTVSLQNGSLGCPSVDAIFLNFQERRHKNEIMEALFPRDRFSSTSGVTKTNFNPVLGLAKTYLEKNYGLFWEIFEALDSNKGENISTLMPAAPVVKVEMEKILDLLSAAVNCFLETKQHQDDEELLGEVNAMLDELKQLSLALHISGKKFKDSISTIGALSKRLLSRRPRLEPFLDQLFSQHDKLLKCRR